VVGEKASQDSQIPRRLVAAPVVILMVSLVPCRLVGETEICREFEDTSNPLMKTRMTGESAGVKGAMMLV
jgi:hypothetical protein